MKGSELLLVIPRQRILSSLGPGLAGPWDLLVMNGCTQAQLQAVFFYTFPHWDAPVCQGAVVLDLKQYLPNRLDWSHSIFLLEDYTSLPCLSSHPVLVPPSHSPPSGRQMRVCLLTCMLIWERGSLCKIDMTRESWKHSHTHMHTHTVEATGFLLLSTGRSRNVWFY